MRAPVWFGALCGVISIYRNKSRFVVWWDDVRALPLSFCVACLPLSPPPPFPSPCTCVRSRLRRFSSLSHPRGNLPCCRDHAAPQPVGDKDLRCHRQRVRHERQQKVQLGSNLAVQRGGRMGGRGREEGEKTETATSTNIVGKNTQELASSYRIPYDTR